MKSANPAQPLLVGETIYGGLRQMHAHGVIGGVQADLGTRGEVEEIGLAGRLKNRLADAVDADA